MAATASRKWKGPEDDTEEVVITNIACQTKYRGVAIRASDSASIHDVYINGMVCREWDGFTNSILIGGIGYGKKSDSLKDEPQKGQKIVLMGGDNYRIGMGGGAVSSVATGEYDNSIELNAVQRSNPEMQKRVSNAIRALAESKKNPIISIHDHGAGGHLNCLSELVENIGGKIQIEKLPIGDPTLSDKEIVGNESQERMGMILKEQDTKLLKEIPHDDRLTL